MYQPSGGAPRVPLPQTADSYRLHPHTPLPSLHPGPVLPIFPFAPVGIAEMFLVRRPFLDAANFGLGVEDPTLIVIFYRVCINCLCVYALERCLRLYGKAYMHTCLCVRIRLCINYLCVRRCVLVHMCMHMNLYAVHVRPSLPLPPPPPTGWQCWKRSTRTKGRGFKRLNSACVTRSEIWRLKSRPFACVWMRRRASRRGEAVRKEEQGEENAEEGVQRGQGGL
jgi:hypothetical protein